MATLPAFLRRSEVGPESAQHPETHAQRRTAPARSERDPFQLRALPQDDVFFYCKKIDNSRLVREPDPQSRGACWGAIGAAAVLVTMLSTALAPSVANTLSGYKLEALRAEQRRLVDERRTLELTEAELLSPERLQKLARNQNLVTPKSGQVVHLETKDGGTVAMVKQP
jgi:hypothetical protein